MESETTIMKALIVVFIIGMVTMATLFVSDFYHEVQVYDGINVDTIDVPVVETNVYEFKQPMIYYGKN